jgi:mercuric ion binding protein
MNRSLFIILLIVLIGINITLAYAEITNAKVSVVGMSCPFCAYGVEKKLKKVEGVETINVDMKEGTASLSAGEGQSINIAQIPKAVKESGFSPGKIEITAIGNVKRNDQQFALLIPDADLSIPLFKIKRSLRDRLASYEQTGALVEVRGVVHEESGGVWTLSPETVKEVHK